MRNTYPTDISREDFEKVEGLLNATRKKTRPRKHDLFDILCALAFKVKTGKPWRELPEDLPPWRTVHEYQYQWQVMPYQGTTIWRFLCQELNWKEETCN